MLKIFKIFIKDFTNFKIYKKINNRRHAQNMDEHTCIVYLDSEKCALSYSWVELSDTMLSFISVHVHDISCKLSTTHVLAMCIEYE